MKIGNIEIDDRIVRMARLNGTINDLKDDIIEKLIAEKYTVKQEIAINRQRDSKPDEFEAYSSYCDECKILVRTALNL